MSGFGGEGLVRSVEKHGRKNRMSREQYEALVESAHQLAQRDPQGYKLRVLGLAALGYGYCLLVFAAMAGLCAFFIWFTIFGHLRYLGIKAALIFGLLAFVIIKSMWVKLPPPNGKPISRQEAPQLFELIDELSAKLKTKIHTVLIDTDYNASVEQRPRLGLLGFDEHILHLGIPYLMSNSPDQFRATLAHELGHLSGNHGVMSSRMYSLRVTWQLVLDELRVSAAGAYAVFYIFANWYMPIFSAYTFSMARRHEEEADISSCEIAGVKPAAEEFVRSSITSRYIEEHFWKPLFEMPKTMPEPPTDLYLQLAQKLRDASVPPAEAKEWLAETLKRPSTIEDPHPSVYERIKVLNCPELNPDRLMVEGPPEYLLSVKENAADYFIGKNKVDALMRDFSVEAHDLWKEMWQARYEEFEQARKTFAELDQLHHVRELDKEELFQYYCATSEIQGPKEAHPVAEEALQRFPSEAWPHAAVGFGLLEEKNDQAVDLLERAMELDVVQVPHCCAALCKYFNEVGDKERVKKYEKRIEEYEDMLGDAQDERSNVKDTDVFEPHGLNETELAAVRETLSRIFHVEYVYLAKKHCTLLSDIPHYVFVIKAEFALSQSERNEAVLVDALTQLNASFPHGYNAVMVDGFRKKLEERIKQIPDSLVYSQKALKR